MKSWIEISSARLAENFRAVQAVAGAAVEVLAVVKANGYGHDASLCAPLLATAGAAWLGVSDVEEGARVRQTLGANSAARILVMCGMELDDAQAMVTHDLTPVIWTCDHFGALERTSRVSGHKVRVHLEIDTGMGRQGVAPGPELAKVLERLASSQRVCCEGLMTHLCASEVAVSSVTARQRERFAAAIEQITAAGLKPDLLHIGNSSAVDEGSTMEWIREVASARGARAMVRTGLAVYGLCLEIEGGAAGALAPRLQPALTWKTRITGLREIEAGDTVGYGAAFTAKAPMRLALLPVGYADGFRRAASSGIGNGWVMIAGKRAPVVGRVSMNLTTVDVTAIPEAHTGGDAVILGEGVTAEDHAHWAATIPYDILCGIRARFTLA